MSTRRGQYNSLMGFRIPALKWGICRLRGAAHTIFSNQIHSTIFLVSLHYSSTVLYYKLMLKALVIFKENPRKPQSSLVCNTQVSTSQTQLSIHHWEKKNPT